MTDSVGQTPASAHEDALRRILDAWEDAMLDGIAETTLAQAAMFAAIYAMVGPYGETAVQRLLTSLGDSVSRGDFSAERRIH